MAYLLRTHRRIASTAALALLVGPFAGWAAPAGAQESDALASTPFTVAALASPIVLEFTDSGAPVLPGGEVLTATPSITRAELDSIGNSTGFAGGPYPGNNITALMGAFNAVSPTGPIMPEYPFSVSSRFPGDPEQTKENGPHRLAATSGEHGSEAAAYFGLVHGNPGVASASSQSIAKQDPATRQLTAQADSLIDGFTVGPTLTIGHVSGHAVVSARPGEEPTKESSFAVGSLTVMGTLVGITDKGLVPVSSTPPGTDVNALTKQLQAAGVTLTLLPARGTDSAIDSAGLVIGVAHVLPNKDVVEFKIVLGRVRAQVDSGG